MYSQSTTISFNVPKLLLFLRNRYALSDSSPSVFFSDTVTMSVYGAGNPRHCPNLRGQPDNTGRKLQPLPAQLSLWFCRRPEIAPENKQTEMSIYQKIDTILTISERTWKIAFLTGKTKLVLNLHA